MPKQISGRGFTLLELMVSMALGLIVMAAMASLFKTGMNSTMLVTQRAETQQNMRAAIDLMVKDISMAGAGVPSGGIQLPLAGGASSAKFGCDQGGTCHVVNHTYPTGNYMYGIIPGYNNGVEAGASIPAAPAPVINDSITVIYCDYNFPLWEYNVTFPTGPTGTQINLTVNSAYAANPPVAPNAAGGIQAGDLILINGINGVTAVGEVTGVTATSISFADTDPLNMNWSGGTHTNNVYAVSSGTGYAFPVPVTVPQTTQGTAYRLYAVTYYLTVPAAGQTPRLMRQVNGLAPVPVADDIINLQFAFDTYNSTTSALDANQINPLGVGESPNLIQKVNISIIGQSLINNGNKSQNMYLATSVSARNMAFRNSYQ
ncbi:MAG TPA: prepilin-type N-terminal cleavage/methylation domain-containing protein [Candidatus Sulfotelmatobacter sp.]|nr:prepilin-type N-terminal cleavage/methylation domain-containing protein [Candidatus Sulfotelmatobacter sp.]